jgi:hypothetical protein
MKEQPENWDKWSVERQIGYNLAIAETEETNDRIVDTIGTTLAVFYIIIAVLLILALFTIIGFELASAIWGDYAVIYWLADLI